MTVALLVVIPNSTEYSSIYVPLATEEVFERVWMSGAKEINAKWLPLFQSGTNISAESFEDVSRELNAFRQWVIRKALSADESELILSRIGALLNVLDRLGTQTNGNVTVFIG